MAVDWMMVGAVTDSGFTVTADLSASDTTPRLAVSTSSAMTSPTYFAGSASDNTYGGNRIEIAATGLSARTQYWCQVELDAGLDTNFTGHLWTLPTEGTASSFHFVHSACSDHVTDVTAGDVSCVELWGQGGMFCHLGDFHYQDSLSTSASTRAGYYDSQLTSRNMGDLALAAPIVYTHDDHDFADNDSDAGDGTATAQNLAYRAVFPHYTLADGTYTIAHSFQVGRVYVIVTDLRSQRDSNAATDNSSKTMMGDSGDSFDQKAWFKAELDAARDAHCSAVVWLNSQVWPSDGTGTAGGSDEWHAFSTERTELADYLNADPDIPKVLILSGDMHSSARLRNADYSTAGDGVGAIDVFQCASISKAANTRGSTWDSGPTGGDQQFGRLVIKDTAAGVWVDWVVADEPFTTSATANHFIDYQIDVAQPTVETDSASASTVVTFADGHTASAMRALVDL